MLEPLKPVSRGARIALGAAFFVVFFAAWALATFGGAIDAMFLKDPLYTLRSGVNLFREFGFIGDVGITVFRVVGGFVLAALVAVPLGIAMGAFKPIEAFFEPFISFARYLPASAFIPLLILWAGVGETQKLLVIFIGSVFQVILMVAVIVGATRRDLVEAAYTLGRGRRRHRPPRDASERRAADRRDAAPGARLGLDLRDRGRAGRRAKAASAT